MNRQNSHQMSYHAIRLLYIAQLQIFDNVSFEWGYLLASNSSGIWVDRWTFCDEAFSMCRRNGPGIQPKDGCKITDFTADSSHTSAVSSG